MPVKKVLLVEPSASGHHMALYLRHVVRGLAAEGIEMLLLTTKEAQADPAFQLVKTELPNSAMIFHFELAPRKSSYSATTLVKRQLSNWLRLRSAVEKVITSERPDVAYVPTIDWIAKATEVLGSPFGKLPFVALYMAPKHHRFSKGIGPKSRSDGIYDKLFSRLLKISTLKKILVIDETFYEFAKERYGRDAKKVAFAPDFCVVKGRSDDSHARRRLGISKSSKVLLVYGSLTMRKGIKELLEALSTEDLPKNLTVLLAGRPAPDVDALLQRPEFREMIQTNKIVTRFKFHNTQEESEVFSASDAVWCGYVHGFCGSSGVLHQSVGFGLPVIASTTGLVGALVDRSELGVTLDPMQTSTVALTLKKLAEGRISASVSQENLNEFSRKYSSRAHTRSALRALGVQFHEANAH